MSNLKAVLVEDEALLRLVTVEALQLAGFNVLEACDGVDALALLAQNPDVSMLISDVKMPRMDGYTLVRETLAQRPHLKIILMTGFAEEPPAGLLRQGQVELFHKPFDIELLAERAFTMLSAPSPN